MQEKKEKRTFQRKFVLKNVHHVSKAGRFNQYSLQSSHPTLKSIKGKVFDTIKHLARASGPKEVPNGQLVMIISLLNYCSSTSYFTLSTKLLFLP